MTSVPTGSRSDRLGFALQHNEDVDLRRDGRQPSQHRIRDPPSARPVDGGQQNVQRPNTLATTRRHRPLCATGSIREVDPRTIGSRTISARPGPCRYSSSPIHDIASGSSRRASLTESPAKERHCFGHLSGEAHSIARTAPPVRAPNRAASTLDAAPESTVRGSHVMCPARPGPIGESQKPCPAAARASPGIPPLSQTPDTVARSPETDTPMFPERHGSAAPRKSDDIPIQRTTRTPLVERPADTCTTSQHRRSVFRQPRSAPTLIAGTC